MNPENVNNPVLTPPPVSPLNPSTPPASSLGRYFLWGGLLALLIAGGIFFGYRYLTEAVVVTKEQSYKVGVIVRGKSYEAGVRGFKSKMTELGYYEGKNISYDVRYVESSSEIPAVVIDMISNGVDLLHTYSTPVTIEAAKQTKKIPIVFGSMGDPLASGLVDTLKEPGRNVTGVVSLSVDLVSKRLELLKELFPKAKRIAFALTPTDVAGKRSREVIAIAASQLGVEIVPYEIIAPQTATSVAATILRKDVDGIVLSSDSATWGALSSYVTQAKKEKLPFAVFDKDMVESGGLVGYGPDYFAAGEQSAVMVKKIFEGADPAKLPVESPTRLVLAFNLKTAGELGLTVSDSFLAKVDYLVK